MNLEPVITLITGPAGGWGSWFLTVVWMVWAVMTDRLVTPGRHRERIEELQDRLARTQEDKEFWRQAATASSELGALLGKARVEGRRREDL